MTIWTTRILSETSNDIYGGLVDRSFFFSSIYRGKDTTTFDCAKYECFVYDG